MGRTIAIALSTCLGLFPQVSLASDTKSEVSVNRIADSIIAYVAGETGLSESDIELDHLGLAAGIECDEESTISVRAIGSDDLVGRTDFWLEIDEAEGRCTSLRVNPTISQWRLVPVAVQTVAANQLVEIKSVRAKQHVNTGVLVEAGSGPWVSLRSIKAGEVVNMRMVKVKPATLNGEEVILLAEAGALVIKSSGRIMSDAAVGDSVKVASVATGSIVVGVLTKPGVVLAGGSL